MAGLIYDEKTLVQNQMYKYDKYLHTRMNKYTGDARTLVTYWNINDAETTTSLGMGTHYQILGVDSPLRYDRIENMVLLGFNQAAPNDDKQVTGSTIRNYGVSGECFIIPGTIMPRENDMFIVNHLRMEHIFRVTQVTQDGLTTDGSYRISYSLYTTNPKEICFLEKQTVNKMIMDLQTIGGSDLTPVIGEKDYDHRSRLIRMVDDMVENYIARYYDEKHNCFLLHLNGRTLFDVCGHYFMARTGVMICDNHTRNVVLTDNKLRTSELEYLYQKSPFKWIERDAPLSYLDTFKYHLVKASQYPSSSFALYGEDIDIIYPHDPWCNMEYCHMYFPLKVYEVLESDCDCRCCCECDCKNCQKAYACHKDWNLKRRDYVSLIHNFIHGNIKSIHDLSPYIGDQLFDMSMSEQIYLWTPMIIYIIKQTLKIK